MLFAGPLAGILGRRVGSKWPLAIGMALIMVGAGALAAFHDEPWQIIAAMACLSAGVGFSYAAMAALITEAVAPTETGVATGINTVMRTVGWSDGRPDSALRSSRPTRSRAPMCRRRAPM